MGRWTGACSHAHATRGHVGDGPSLGTRVEAEVVVHTVIPRFVGKGAPLDPLQVVLRGAPRKKPLGVGPDWMPQRVRVAVDDIANLLRDNRRRRWTIEHRL